MPQEGEREEDLVVVLAVDLVVVLAAVLEFGPRPDQEVSTKADPRVDLDAGREADAAVGHAPPSHAANQGAAPADERGLGEDVANASKTQHLLASAGTSCAAEVEGDHTLTHDRKQVLHRRNLHPKST